MGQVRPRPAARVALAHERHGDGDVDDHAPAGGRGTLFNVSGRGLTPETEYKLHGLDPVGPGMLETRITTDNAGR